MGDFNSRYIALIQENLSKSRWKCPKICKIAKPLKTAKHIKLMRKFHIQHQLKKSASKEAIYWTSLKHKNQNISIAAFGDCVTEEIIPIEDVSKDGDDADDDDKRLIEAVVLFKPRLFECIFVTPDFSELRPNDTIEGPNAAQMLICQFSERFNLHPKNFQQRMLNVSNSIKYYQNPREKCCNDSNYSVIDINLSIIDDKSQPEQTEFTPYSAYEKTFSNLSEIREQDDSKNYSEISNKSMDNTNNHQFARCVTPECWPNNSIVALEEVLWNSVIPRSWIFLFQFSDYYLESCILSMLTTNLRAELVQANAKPKEIKKTLRKIKTPLLMTNNLWREIARKVYQSLIVESVVVVTRSRRVPRNAMKIERISNRNKSVSQMHTKRNSININNSDSSRPKPNVLQEVLVQSKKQIEKSIINQSLNRNLRVHNRHKRFITPFDYRFNNSPIKTEISNANVNVVNCKLRPRLERITIKTNKDRNKRNNCLTELKIAPNRSQNATAYYKDLLENINLV